MNKDQSLEEGLGIQPKTFLQTQYTQWYGHLMNAGRT